MDADQYEELCRHFIAVKAGLSLDEVKSVRIPNPQRPGLPAYKHQIDLYWETGDEVAQYLNIANAKWRASGKVDQDDVMLLQQVRLKVAAHKAFMISSVGFTAGAVAAAQDDGIALHVVTPAFDTSLLPRGDKTAIRSALQSMVAASSLPIFNYSIEYRGLDFASGPAAVPTSRRLDHGPGPGGRETRVLPPATPATRGHVERRGGPAPRTRDNSVGPERRG
jgi:hypothetical protein